MTVIRIPNLPTGEIVREDGTATDDELTFRTTLITSLQQNFGNEGVVVPTQDSVNIGVIQNNQLPDGQYSCQPGTIIYNSTNDTLMVSILVAGVPVFKTFTVT
jgi:hypothetical protein